MRRQKLAQSLVSPPPLGEVPPKGGRRGQPAQRPAQLRVPPPSLIPKGGTRLGLSLIHIYFGPILENVVTKGLPEIQREILFLHIREKKKKRPEPEDLR